MPLGGCDANVHSSAAAHTQPRNRLQSRRVRLEAL